jgi:riboflavin kinase/FMN adenylyltransferase
MPLLHLNWDDDPPSDCRGGAVAVGNFDGVHLGHASLMHALRKAADAAGGPAVVVSFDPHPLLLLAPDRFRPVLNTPEDRAVYLEQAGADRIVMLRTTPELLHLTPEAFFEQILRGGLNARAIVEGFNFRFGHDRAGDNLTLARLCLESSVKFTEVPPLQLDGSPVSSSRVRSALIEGDVVEAARLMGRPYRLWGEVGSGQRRGRTLGFPTANLERIQTLVPGDGVYAVRVELEGKSWPGAANVGPNPTFGEHERKIEVHLLDFDGDLYGRRLAVTFLKRVRDTRPFAGAEDLIRQLRNDVNQVRTIVAENRP